MAVSALWSTWMSSEVELLQGALDLILLRALEAMGPQHAYSLAARLEQVSKSRLTLMQGTLYPALVRLEQNGWIKGSWRRTENNRDPPGPEIFVSLERSGTDDEMFSHSSPYFAVRTDIPPASLIPAIRRIVNDVDPRTAPDRIATMEQILSNSILQPRFYAGMFGLFALMAGTLAVVGVYGGIAFAVSRRTREIGIRMALGASKYQVFRAIVGDMLLLAVVGIVAGVAGGAILTRYLEQMLFDLTPLDPAVFIATPLVLASAVLGAAFLSARPALSVAALAALRHE